MSIYFITNAFLGPTGITMQMSKVFVRHKQMGNWTWYLLWNISVLSFSLKTTFYS